MRRCRFCHELIRECICDDEQPEGAKPPAADDFGPWQCLPDAPDAGMMAG